MAFAACTRLVIQLPQLVAGHWPYVIWLRTVDWSLSNSWCCLKLLAYGQLKPCIARVPRQLSCRVYVSGPVITHKDHGVPDWQKLPLIKMISMHCCGHHHCHLWMRRACTWALYELLASMLDDRALHVPTSALQILWQQAPSSATGELPRRVHTQQCVHSRTSRSDVCFCWQRWQWCHCRGQIYWVESASGWCSSWGEWAIHVSFYLRLWRRAAEWLQHWMLQKKQPLQRSLGLKHSRYHVTLQKLLNFVLTSDVCKIWHHKVVLNQKTQTQLAAARYVHDTWQGSP